MSSPVRLSWLKHLVRRWSSRCRPVRCRPARSRPLALEQLEVRLTPSSLGTNALLEGPSAGGDADIVVAAGAWTAKANDPWLHASPGGTGNGLATFTYDANPGATRTGTLTIAGLTLTVTQAGSSYLAANPVVPLASGLNQPNGVAVDAAGNVYFADTGNNALKEWKASTGQVSPPLFSSPTFQPAGVAVDAAGNVYIADDGNDTLEEWNATKGLTQLASGLNGPTGVAVDAAGNVYIADTFNFALKEWNATNGLTTLISFSSAKSEPEDVAVDAAGNVYFDFRNITSTIEEWNAATHQVSPVVASGEPMLDDLEGVAVDAAGNLYFADIGNNVLDEWNASTQQISPLVSGLSGPLGVAVDAARNVYFTDSGNNAIKDLVHAYVPGGAFSEASTAGSDALMPVLPTTQVLAGPLAPTSDQSWLTIGPIANGVTHFSFSANPGLARTAHITVLGQSITVTQAGQTRLGTTSLVEGPSAGGDSDIVATSLAWTATANVAWLHTSSQGSGNGVAPFSFDANPGVTRTGTLTIAGLTLTVTQAGSSYLAPSPPVTTLASSGLDNPAGVAVDAAGNVYFADQLSNALKEWIAATGQVSTLVSSGLDQPFGVAVDAAGNVYIADSLDNAIKEWNATNGLTTLISSGLNRPQGVAVDASGNLFIADANDHALKEWNATSGLTTLVSSGLSLPYGVAVDAAGNVYIADYGNSAIDEWNAKAGLTTLISSGLNSPQGVAVDVSGNVYVADAGNNAVEEWNASTRMVAALVSTGLRFPSGVAVDAAANVFFADSGNDAIKERVRAYVPGNAVGEGPAAGSDSLLPVLPTTQSLTGLFAPTSDQSWLTIGPIANGVVNFSFPVNTGATRTAHITVLGRSITVTQAGPKLGSSALVEGPSAGTDSDIVVSAVAWTATADVSWLHTSSHGSGNGLATFTFDANPGATRTGTLTIAGQTLTVTQAGSSYLAANFVPTLFSAEFADPQGVAVDAAGNVYFADQNDNTIKEWNAATGKVTPLVSGLNKPTGVAVDSAGNVYFTDTGNNMLKEWNAATGKVTPLVSSGLNEPLGVAVDAAGNVYVADYGNNLIEEWVASTREFIPLISRQLVIPEGVAVDAVGNLYISIDALYGPVYEWNASTRQLSPLISSGLNFPAGLAVDGSGNVYIGDPYDNAIYEYGALTQQLAPLVSEGFGFHPYGVAVDAAGNVYYSDSGHGVVNDLVHAYVPGGGVSEGPAAGSDALLPVLPTTQSLTGLFAPTSDQSWLTIGASANGVVHFSFTANTGAARVAHITVLGQSITVTQAAFDPNAAYVDSVYARLLDRAPDPVGAQGWVGFLDAGGSPARFVAAVEASPEYRGDLVTALYEHYLHRPPTRAAWRAGSTGWGPASASSR